MVGVRSLRIWMAAVLLLGAVVLGQRIGRPIDGHTIEAWRETDVGGIARNFSREGMRLFYPQIDWRGDGPGYVEGEFPAYPYLIAIGYRTFGFHEQIGRIISWLVTLGTLALVLALAAHLLPPETRVLGTVAAGLFFLFDPLTNRVAPAIQPEALMLMAYVGAVYAYVRWLDDDSWWWYGWALAATAFAILAKLPAAHLGLVFLPLTLWRRGWSAFARPRLWVLAVASLAPGIAWYVHARRFWDVYGNSLGLSNHHHLVALTPLSALHYLAGILAIDVPYAWTAAGLLTVIAAVAVGPWLAAYTYGLLWYAAVMVYYLVIAGTAAASWAAYYHVVSVPPIALLFGASAAAIWTRARALDGRGRGAVAAVAGGLLVVWVGGQRVAENAGRSVLAACIGAVALAGALTQGLRRPWRVWQVVGSAGVIVGAGVIALMSAARQTAREAHQDYYVPQYEAAQQFKPLMAPGGLIIVSSRACMPRDESAGNLPWYLYWTDHHGFDLCADSQTVGSVERMAGRGARYFIEDRAIAAHATGFDAALRAQYPVLKETPVAVLFELKASGQRPVAGGQ
jgi:hypothetical protein